MQPVNNQLSVQVIPLFFRELLSDASRQRGNIWAFDKQNIVIATDLELNPQLVTQYHNISNGAPAAPAAPAAPSSPKVVKLFDDKA